MKRKKKFNELSNKTNKNGTQRKYQTVAVDASSIRRQLHEASDDLLIPLFLLPTTHLGQNPKHEKDFSLEDPKNHRNWYEIELGTRNLRERVIFENDSENLNLGLRGFSKSAFSSKQLPPRSLSLSNQLGLGLRL